MKNILLLPLDERPCNYKYPSMLPTADCCVKVPPFKLLGDKKRPADRDAIAQWLLDEAKRADAMVLSLDMLVYGGIVPSRLHGEGAEALKARADLVYRLKELNPDLKLYLFQLIMRCPSYSLDDEEPAYYADYGREIHLYGRYTHLEKLGRLTEEEAHEFTEIKKRIPKNVLDDFIARRKTNLDVLLHDLLLVKNGIADYFVVPQDDAAVYGFTSLDQMTVRSYLKENTLHMKTAMYPSADEIGLTLLARAAGEGKPRLKVYVGYSSSKAGGVVPWFEDRVLDETVQYHILSAGAQRVYSLPEADIALAINMGSGMFHEDEAGFVTAYDVERNLASFVSFIRYALSEGKIVAVGDVAYCNGSDEELLRVLREEDLLMKIHSYAGWNTSSNTLGTALSAAMLYAYGGDERGRERFLLHRYYEDLGYMHHTRSYVTEHILPALGLDYFTTDGKAGKAAEEVKRELKRYMAQFSALSERVAEIQVEMPWRRMFETDITLKIR